MFKFPKLETMKNNYLLLVSPLDLWGQKISPTDEDLIRKKMRKNMYIL